MDENAEALRATKKASQIRSFNRLLGVMNHQRILVMVVAIAQTVKFNRFVSANSTQSYFICFYFLLRFQALSHFILFLVALGLIHAKEIADILLMDQLDQKEREEYYETPKFHGVSTNVIRFMEADKLSTYTLVIMYIATAIAGIYVLCTWGLLIGVYAFSRISSCVVPILIDSFLHYVLHHMPWIIRRTDTHTQTYGHIDSGTMKRRCELMLPWMVFYSIVCVVSGMRIT